MEQKAIYEVLESSLPEAMLGFTGAEGGAEAHADVAPGKIVEVCQVLRDDERLDFDMMMCLSSIDWDGYDEAGKGKSVAILGYTDEGKPETSERVGEGDLGVAYHFYSHALKHKFALRVRVARDVATVPTVSHLWATAGWHEREAWDLMGIRFAGHPDLRRMLLEENWVGHPLRKDYQMPSRWEEVPMEGQPYSESPFPSEEPAEPAGDKPAED